ncbi:MAG: DUF2868 domain-containing protein [Planctomycetes bacterium]|nr:DUF2868 domain-containing protein [Planctomycetota bacterium]
MTPAASQNRDSQVSSSIGFDDRLLAEALRAYEHDQTNLLDEPQAISKALQTDGDFEQRIIVHAQSLSITTDQRAAIKRITHMLTTIVVILLIIAMLAGAGAVRAMLVSDRQSPVNFFWVLTGLLGVQSVLLVVWFIFMVVRSSALNTGSLGAIALRLANVIAAKVYKGRVYTSAIEAIGISQLQSKQGKWTLSAISHAAWAGFCVGCLTLMIIMLSTRHYTFAWETTILSSDTYKQIASSLSALPNAVGFSTPSQQQIENSQWPISIEQSQETRHAWSQLLIGCIVVYGLAPRLILMGLCLQRRSASRKRWRLDTTHSGYLRLKPLLMPQSTSLGIVDADNDKVEDSTTKIAEPSQENETFPKGPPVIIGLEIQEPKTAWPPPLSDVSFIDLGFVDTSDDRHQFFNSLSSLQAQPGIIIIACALTTTPDRGIAVFISKVQSSANCPVGLLLTGGDYLRKRSDAQQMQDRIEDWRKLAKNVSIAAQHVIELDLDYATDASLAKLELLMGATPRKTQARHIEEAFSLIVNHVARWDDAPKLEQQAELHRDIAKLYKNDQESWREFFHLPMDLKGDLSSSLKGGAQRVVGLLPNNLRLNPRWMAAGALTGALGCVAAATLLSPIAIGALPLWSGIGAAIATATAAFRKPAAELSGDESAKNVQLTESVQAATLFALLLELQGRDETAITQVLEQVLDCDESVECDNAQSTERWLDDVRHRFDLALAKESS